ncbi:MAG: hypothetical protein ACPGEF_05405 [Endozoicomonas sp.]
MQQVLALLFILSHYESIDLGQQDRVKDFDQELGFFSNRKKEVIDAMSNEFNRGEGKNMVHHGADTHNPFTDMSINLPTTVVIPESIKNSMGIYSDSPILIKTEQELIKFYRVMRDSGIHIEANKKWESLKAVAKEKINEKIDQFGGKRKSI